MADDWVLCPHESSGSTPWSRWFPEQNLSAACYVWLPMRFDAGALSLDWRPAWDVDDPFATPPQQHWACTEWHYMWVQHPDMLKSWVATVAGLVASALIVTIGVVCWWCLVRGRREQRGSESSEEASGSSASDSSETESMLHR
mmetsp:Transcript_21878/g.62513  ORF Transcript_21878/g.62513 Transcript_21878/m.62513 type:complete len:143 (-) Transcript_21878:66-494(-)